MTSRLAAHMAVYVILALVASTANAGDGWVLVGDALGFIDPVYSSGVFFALEMGVRAGDAVAEGLRKNDLSGQQLGCW